MTLSVDSVLMPSDSILEFDGYLIKVSSLYKDFQTLFRRFENSLENENKYFSSEVMTVYRQTSVYFVPLNDTDTGLDSLVLNSTSHRWIAGKIFFKPALVFRQKPEEGYEISPIQYDDSSVIKIGTQILKPSSILDPCVQYLKAKQGDLAYTIAEGFRQIIQESNQSLFHPSKPSECVEIEILQPGQDWVKCRMDLHLSLRIYQNPNPKPIHQMIYFGDPVQPEASKISSALALQLGNDTLTIDSLRTKIAISFRVFERNYLDKGRYYQDCPILEKNEIQSLRRLSGVLLVRQQSDSQGLACKLLDLESGAWLEGEIAFELLPYFSPYKPEDLVVDSISNVTEASPSPLDDIRQTMNQDPQ